MGMHLSISSGSGSGSGSGGLLNDFNTTGNLYLY